MDKPESTISKRSIGMVGFGKIGQAISSRILEQGHRVIAVDTDPSIKTAFENDSFETSEPGVGSILVESFSKGKLAVETDFSTLADCRALIVCIPLLVKECETGSTNIDFNTLENCMVSLSDVVHDRMLISLETTVPVGTCRNRIVSVFEVAAKRHGRDYLLAFSPERIMSNTMREQLLTNPKIVAGLDNDALDAAIDLYKSFLPDFLVKPVSSLEVAEMIKLTAMVARDVNLGLVNHISRFCDAARIDIREVLSLVNTDGVTNMLSPGIGVGGHCTPVYPHFLIENFTEQNMQFSLAREARMLNDTMAEYLISSTEDLLPIGSALLLGLGFRPGVKEDAFSPAYRVKNVLDKRDVRVFIWDPLYEEVEISEKGFNPVSEPYSGNFDALFLITAHEQFLNLDYELLFSQGTRLIVDGRNCLDQDRINACGITYRGVGTGTIRPIEVLETAETTETVKTVLS